MPKFKKGDIVSVIDHPSSRENCAEIIEMEGEVRDCLNPNTKSGFLVYVVDMPIAVYDLTEDILVRIDYDPQTYVVFDKDEESIDYIIENARNEEHALNLYLDKYAEESQCRRTSLNEELIRNNVLILWLDKSRRIDAKESGN